MTDFQVHLLSQTGQFIADLGDFFRLQYTLTEIGVGALEITLPPTHDGLLFSNQDVIVDQRIEVSRRSGAGAFVLEGQATWLIQTGRQAQSAGRTTSLRAFHANDLLRRRIVAYAAASAQADKAANEADDMMKDIVDENFSASATDVARRLSAGYFTIQGDLSDGASIAKAFSRRIVLNVLQELAQASAAAGTYLSFDVVNAGGGIQQFRTYTGQRGNDHRQQGGSPPLLIGPAYGNLLDAAIEFNHEGEVTYVYAGGQGEEAARAIGTASDATRIALSPFGRREQFIDARMTDDATQLSDEADAALQAGTYKIILSGNLQDTDGFVYGVDYAWGDYLTIGIGAFNADCRLSVVTVTLENGREGIQQTVQAPLKGEVS